MREVWDHSHWRYIIVGCFCLPSFTEVRRLTSQVLSCCTRYFCNDKSVTVIFQNGLIVDSREKGCRLKVLEKEGGWRLVMLASNPAMKSKSDYNNV